jgi:lysophospholipase L1-like esterase
MRFVMDDGSLGSSAMTTIDRAGLDSFVALGDSFTEGLEDERGPDGRHRGWADRVAAALATRNGRVRYANLAIRGRLLDQVIAEQVPAAIELAPALISFHAGPNDVLRPRVDLPALLLRYEAAVERLRASGAEVLLFTVIGRAGTGRTADLLDSRFGAFNTAVREIAARHGCPLVDMGATASLRDQRLWHEDRLHLAPEGHARVAAAALEQLGFSEPELLAGAVGWWREPLPPDPRGRWIVARSLDLRADLRWVRRYFLPWVGRRLRGVSSGDLLAAKQVGLVEVVRTSELG